MTPREVLVAARKLVATPEQWIKGSFARNLQGKDVGTFDHYAKSFCMLGALYATCRNEDSHDAEMCLLAQVRKSSSFGSISGYNDSTARTHADVLGVYDAAIASCPAP